VGRGQTLNLEVQPKPRLAFLGLEVAIHGPRRFLAQLESLGDRLQQLTFLPAHAVNCAEALARLKASRETELVLIARPSGCGHPPSGTHRGHLDGEEESRAETTGAGSFGSLRRA